jgi:hypothetical protein
VILQDYSKKLFNKRKLNLLCIVQHIDEGLAILGSVTLFSFICSFDEVYEICNFVNPGIESMEALIQ